MGRADPSPNTLPQPRPQPQPQAQAQPELEPVQELVEGTQEAPYFFSHADLVAHWSAKTGKSRQVRPHAH